MSIQQPTSDKRGLSLFQTVCYGFLTLPIAMGGLVLVLFLPTFYAVQLGIGLTSVGLIIGLGRILDVVTDPIIGRWSDNTVSKWGPRRPWILVGLPLYMVAVWFFFLPPEGAGIVYLVLASSAYFLFFTSFDVPYSSVGLEISPHLHERTDIASTRAVFQVLGALAAATLPVAMALNGAQALEVIVYAMLATATLGLAIFWFGVPQHNRPASAERPGILDALRTVMREPGYGHLLGSFLLVQVANAFPAALTVLFISQIIGAPEQVNIALMLIILASAVFLPIWMYLSRKVGKRRTWMTSIVVCCLALGSTPFLGSGDVVPFFVLCLFLGAAFGCDTIMPTSMLADIVYRTELRGESRFGGTFLAAKNAVSKLAFVAPLLVAFPILDLVGFDAQGSNDSAQTLTLVLFFGPISVLLRLVALFILTRASELQHPTSGDQYAAV